MRIDRLVLHTNPLSEAEARHLARLVAEDLARLGLPGAGAVRVDVDAPQSGGIAPLRDAIVAAVERALTGGRRAGGRS